MRKIVSLESATNLITRKCLNTIYILKNTGQATPCVLKFVAVLLCLTFLFSFTLKQRQMSNSIQVIRKVSFVKWKSITGFPGYYISNTGIIRYKKSILTPKVNPNNRRLFVFMRSDDMYVAKFIHQLVWRHFGNTEIIDGNEIHHKDENLYNNNISNLEYLPMVDHKKKHFGV